MKCNDHPLVSLQSGVVAVLFCYILLVPSVGFADPALVQGFGVSAGASINNSQTAGILVLVIDPVSGKGINNLGADVPLTGSPISLPAGWSLAKRFGVCVIDPLGFTNQGDGAYFIDIRPRPGAAPCALGTWLGNREYGFNVTINNAGATSFQGIGLVFLEINP